MPKLNDRYLYQQPAYLPPSDNSHAFTGLLIPFRAPLRSRDKMQGEPMEIRFETHELASKIVNELLRRKHKLKHKNSEFELTEVWTGDTSFTEIQNYYKEVLLILEHNYETRRDLVHKLKTLHQQGFDLNQFYPTNLLVEEGSLLSLLS